MGLFKWPLKSIHDKSNDYIFIYLVVFKIYFMLMRVFLHICKSTTYVPGVDSSEDHRSIPWKRIKDNCKLLCRCSEPNPGALNYG